MKILKRKFWKIVMVIVFFHECDCFGNWTIDPCRTIQEKLILFELFLSSEFQNILLHVFEADNYDLLWHCRLIAPNLSIYKFFRDLRFFKCFFLKWNKLKLLPICATDHVSGKSLNWFSWQGWRKSNHAEFWRKISTTDF